jgi:hypothetical protein
MEGLLGGSPTVTAARDTARAVGRGFVERMNQPGAVPTMGSNFANLLGDVGEASTGIRAYQGSPHNFAAERLVRMPDGSTQYIVGRPDVLPDVPAGAEVLQDFPLGRMRMDKLGTGEGAQAYGSGIYTAENEAIGKSYRDALADPFESGQTVARAYFNDAGSRAGAVRMLTEQLNGNLPSRISLSPDQTAKMREALDFLKSGADIRNVIPPGSMYEVNINANPDDFINYDAPLSAQGQKVKKQFGYTPKPTPDEEIAAYELAKREAPNNIGEHPAVQDIYRRESAANAAERFFQSKVQGGGVDEAARIGLSQAGIPGIKYFDAGSRGAASGTRNFVVFDDNLISIVRKYGIAGAAAMLGVSAVDVEEAMARGQQQPPQGLLSMGSK